jgi:hypothetical protein
MAALLASPTRAVADDNDDSTPGNPFILLLHGLYEPVPAGQGPNLGLTSVNLNDGTYSKTKIYPVFQAPWWYQIPLNKMRVVGKGRIMNLLNVVLRIVCSLSLISFAALVEGANISGTIATTMTITEDSKLVGNVTCMMSGAPCISIGAPNVSLDLNAFTITGQADPQVACSGGTPTGSESGIVVSGQTGVTIRGPGIVQQFRGFGISLSSAIGTTVARVTTSTNCFSGIIVIGGSLNELTGNISIHNGNVSNPCGGI